MKKTISIVDKNKVVKVNFKYPELMSEDSEKLILDEYYSILDTERELQEERAKVRELEEIVKQKRQKFNDKSNLFELEFSTSNKEVSTTKSGVMFKGCGNDIIGRPVIT